MAAELGSRHKPTIRWRIRDISLAQLRLLPLNCHAPALDYAPRDEGTAGVAAQSPDRVKVVRVMEIVSVVMVVTGALMVAHFVSFVRVRFFSDATEAGTFNK